MYFGPFWLHIQPWSSVLLQVINLSQSSMTQWFPMASSKSHGFSREEIAVHDSTLPWKSDLCHFQVISLNSLVQPSFVWRERVVLPPSSLLAVEWGSTQTWRMAVSEDAETIHWSSPFFSSSWRSLNPLPSPYWTPLFETQTRETFSKVILTVFSPWESLKWWVKGILLE